VIRIVDAGEGVLNSEAVLRSVSADLDADTAFSREVEIGAGPDVTERLKAMGSLPVGAAVITSAGDLSAGFLIHVVLQSPEDPVRPDGLRSALKNGLRRAEEWGLESLSLPPLGTGAGNLDAEEAASIMVPVLTDHLLESRNPREVHIVVGSRYEMDVFSSAVEAAANRVPLPDS
jgi:O-acetyl-ADP-ribose deacetylase (regulator of RNase III)